MEYHHNKMEESMTTTREQRVAMHKLWSRTNELTYRQWRRTVNNNRLLGCLLVEFVGMTVGIEPDGYTHS